MLKSTIVFLTLIFVSEQISQHLIKRIKREYEEHNYYEKKGAHSKSNLLLKEDILQTLKEITQQSEVDSISKQKDKEKDWIINVKEYIVSKKTEKPLNKETILKIFGKPNKIVTSEKSYEIPGFFQFNYILNKRSFSTSSTAKNGDELSSLLSEGYATLVGFCYNELICFRFVNGYMVDIKKIDQL